MKVEKSIEILVAPEKIWPFLVDPEKILMWFDSFKKCEYVTATLEPFGAIPLPRRARLLQTLDLPQYNYIKITSGEQVEKEVQKSSKGNAGYLFIHYKNHR